ncbi:hypothetical cytosolic protein [Syntrophus aciditrophicus SB]|uniref:Hypothetical cytosolic protein n=1 Tax=Syntrophus aciditrophicus (strain SB) TaxID=56780 RepID=Q2LQX2_SYNAS|nr:hypothetical cytosolic protein [Syntrophus aciditrophicus SB]
MKDRIDLIYEGIATNAYETRTGWQADQDRIDLIYEGIATSIPSSFNTRTEFIRQN